MKSKTIQAFWGLLILIIATGCGFGKKAIGIAGADAEAEAHAVVDTDVNANTNGKVNPEAELDINEDAAAVPPATGKGIYYWKTVFRLTDADKRFLAEQDIQRIYLRLFDVDEGVDFDGTEMAVPIATTRFESPVPEGIEIVPVVYLKLSAITKECGLDKLLYERVRAMGQRNGFARIREIQLDCDWTSFTQKNFFGLCRKIRELAHRDSVQVTATIRLHQLRQEAPPVDAGVLMLYNTGSFYRPETKNSILDYKDVEPYLQQEFSYDLPLSWAFPVFGWGILLRENEFCAILHRTDFSDRRLYGLQADGRYKVLRNHSLGEVELLEGDIIRVEKAGYPEIRKVKDKVADRLKTAPLWNIIYHLDSLSLSGFSTTELTDILQ